VPASSLPADLWWVTWVNPLATIIEGTRAAAFGLAGPSAGNILASCIITLLVAAAGVLVFERATRVAIDTA
jgi:ABC-type polysaccharide/polyol phosphate export permease